MRTLHSIGARICRVSRTGVLAAMLLEVLAGRAAAQNLGGEYVLSVDGQVIMALALRQDASGRLTGTVAAAGKELPLSGVVRGGGGVFVSSAPDGSRLHWEVAPQGAGLAVVMAPSGIDGRPDAALAQRHVMLRGRANGGGLMRGSQKWIARLSAAADSIVSWCASPLYAESDLCLNAMQVLRKVAPALMVARFATGGQAGSLLRVLAQGPMATGDAAPPMVATDDSFLSAVEPEPGEPEPMPDDMAEPRPPDVTPGIAAPFAASEQAMEPSPGSAARGASGDWVMLHAGSELLRVRLAEAGGALSGTLSLMGTPFPLAGTARGNRLSFTTQSGASGTARWEGTITADRMVLTLTTSSGTERYELSRQGAGWSDAAPLARQWDEVLRGRAIAHTAGVRDPATGAPVETFLHFCDDGRMRMVVAGRVGPAEPRWRVVAAAEQAALELTAPEGTIQVGLARAGGNRFTFAGQPARLAGPASACR